MTDTDTQTQPDGAAAPPAEDQSGESDLDSLLKEFEQDRSQEQKQGRATDGPDETGTKPKPKPTRTGTQPSLDKLAPVIEFARSAMTKQAEDELKADLDKAFEFFRESDELKEAPTALLRGLAEAYGAEDSSFAEAFRNRKSDPKAWNAALGNARKWAIEQIEGLPGNKVRSDVEAAVASARKTSTKQPDSDGPSVRKMSKMSDQEWMAYLDELQSEAAQPQE